MDRLNRRLTQMRAVRQPLTERGEPVSSTTSASERLALSKWQQFGGGIDTAVYAFHDAILGQAIPYLSRQLGKR